MASGRRSRRGDRRRRAVLRRTGGAPRADTGRLVEAGWLTLLNAPRADRTSASHLVRGPDGTEVKNSTGADLTAWHTYTVEWRAGRVRMYRDDVPILDTGGKPVTVPSVPMFLFIQQQIGPTSSVPAPNGSTPDQVVMHVDWVRYYR